jgi:hypothetical protein
VALVKNDAEEAVAHELADIVLVVFLPVVVVGLHLGLHDSESLVVRIRVRDFVVAGETAADCVRWDSTGERHDTYRISAVCHSSGGTALLAL